MGNVHHYSDKDPSFSKVRKGDGRHSTHCKLGIVDDTPVACSCRHFLLIYGLEPANKTAGDGLFRRFKGPKHQNKQCLLHKELPAHQDETNPTHPTFSAEPFKVIFPPDPNNSNVVVDEERVFYYYNYSKGLQAAFQIIVVLSSIHLLFCAVYS